MKTCPICAEARIPDEAFWCDGCRDKGLQMRERGLWKLLSLRLHRGDLERWKKAADRDRRTVAGYLRAAVEERIERLAPDLAEHQPPAEDETKYRL